jgi:hypothetical protein
MMTRIAYREALFAEVTPVAISTFIIESENETEVVIRIEAEKPMRRPDWSNSPRPVFTLVTLSRSQNAPTTRIPPIVAVMFANVLRRDTNVSGLAAILFMTIHCEDYNSVSGLI